MLLMMESLLNFLLTGKGKIVFSQRHCSEYFAFQNKVGEILQFYVLGIVFIWGKINAGGVRSKIFERLNAKFRRFSKVFSSEENNLGA